MKPVAASLAEAEADDRRIKAHREKDIGIIAAIIRWSAKRLKFCLVKLAVPWCPAFVVHEKPDDYFDVDWRKGVDGGPVKQNLIHDVDTLRAFFGEDIRHGGQ